MPQIKVTVPEEVHNVLKERAERDDRSLNNYLGRLLKQIASQPDIFSTPVVTTPTSVPGIPTTPYQVTATTATTASVPVPAKPKKSIIGDVDENGNLIETPPKTKTEEKTYSSLPDTPTHTNPLKEKVKIYLDTYDVHVKDHSMATYKKLKEKFTKLDLETFDKIQHERAGD